MSILGSSISAASKDMMAKIWTIGDTISASVENIVGKGEIAPFPTIFFQKQSVVDVLKRVSME